MGEGERPDRSRQRPTRREEGAGGERQSRSDGVLDFARRTRVGVIDSAVQVGTDSDSCTSVAYAGDGVRSFEVNWWVSRTESRIQRREAEEPSAARRSVSCARRVPQLLSRLQWRDDFTAPDPEESSVPIRSKDSHRSQRYSISAISSSDMVSASHSASPERRVPRRARRWMPWARPEVRI